MFILLLMACQSGTDPIEPYDAVGATAKGPLIQGSSVSLAPIDASGSPLGLVYPTATRSDLGDFATRIAFAGAVRAEATGFFWSEARLGLSQAPITIRGIGEVAPDGPPLQVNVLTHIMEPRVTALMGDGIPMAVARSDAQDEVVAALGIGPFDPGTWDASTVGLYDGDNDLSAYLFAVSSALATAAGNGTSADAELQSLLNQIGSDLADDGHIEAAIAARVEEGMLTLDVDAVATAFGAWSTARGSTAAVPDMHRVLPDFDADGDGYFALSACLHTDLCRDCDDEDAAVSPDAMEVAYDGVDQDCSGADLVDVDGDGFDGGIGGADCLDGDPDIHPGVAEVPYDDIDQDCSGQDLVDVDGDGFDHADDCADSAGLIHPGATETPYDDVDQDCTGADLVDVDADGFDGGLDGDDCDDDVFAVHPGAADPCYDGVDLDCNPENDGQDCDLDGELVTTDCDDEDPFVYSGAPEICDGQQNDCALSSWSPSLEDGLVTRMSDHTDVSAQFVDGEVAFAFVDLDGDEYTFCNGTWDVNLRASTDATTRLTSLNGAEFTTLDANGARNVFDVSGEATVEIDGFTVRGGRNLDGAYGLGGGAFVSFGGTLRVTDSVFTDNFADTGGGIAVYDAVAYVTDTTFTDNRAYDFGGGMAVIDTGVLESTAHATVLRTEFAGNDADHAGGGLGVHMGASVDVTSCTFDHNQDDVGASIIEGEAIACFQGCDLRIEDSEIANHVGSGSAVLVSNGGLATGAPDPNHMDIVDTEMWNNVGSYGATLNLFGGTTTLLRSTIRDSQGQSAVWLQDRASLSCIDGAIVDNVHDLGAVLMWSTDATFDAQNCDLGEDTHDNAPTDVFIEGPDTTFDYGADATFTCTNDTCAAP